MDRREALLRLCLLGLGIGACPSTGETSTHQDFAIACPSDQALSELVAASDRILIGLMSAPDRATAQGGQSPGWIEIPLSVVGTIKGAAPERAIVRFYNNNAPYAPSTTTVLALADAPAILFLTQVDGDHSNLYFAGSTPAALRSASDAEIAAARTEVARHEMILASWRPDTTLPMYEDVRSLIARLSELEGEEQQQLFDRLQALGPGAVPAIIAQMDDRRLLRSRAISLTNRSPDALEGTRHYRPEQVVDGLDAVLNQLTGAHFASIVNGGSDQHRSAAVAGWRIYAHDRQCGS